MNLTFQFNHILATQNKNCSDYMISDHNGHIQPTQDTRGTIMQYLLCFEEVPPDTKEAFPLRGYFEYVHIILSIITCILHAGGIVLLFKSRKIATNSSHWYCLVNLSLSEILQNITMVIHNSFYFSWHRNVKSEYFHAAFVHTWLILNTIEQ